jgi:hypothetical protein
MCEVLKERLYQSKNSVEKVLLPKISSIYWLDFQLSLWYEREDLLIKATNKNHFSEEFLTQNKDDEAILLELRVPADQPINNMQ